MLHIENNNNKRVKILKSAKKAKDETKNKSNIWVTVDQKGKQCIN